MDDLIEKHPSKAKKSQKGNKVTFELKYNNSDSQESNDGPTNDTDSLYSGSYDSKHSPEYSSGDYEERGIKSKIPPIIRKGIHKYYEPISDCGLTFKYEDDPSEYKKARKRIQNRESASRVRNRKKNYIEELEVEMDQIKEENLNLKTRVAQLEAENNLLKSQNIYIEKVDYSSPLGDSSQQNDNCNDFFVPMGEIKEEDELEPLGSPSMDFIRYSSNVSVRHHITLLGVFTLIICAVGVLGTEAHNTANIMIARLGDLQASGSPVFFNPPKRSLLSWTLIGTLILGYVTYMIYTMNLVRLKYFSGKKKSGRISF